MAKRPIPDFPGYFADDRGRIHGPRGIKSARLGNNGYLRVNLQDANGKKHVVEVHRAVAYAWHGPPPAPDWHAAHRDGNKANNQPDKIVWMSPSENGLLRKKHGARFDPVADRVMTESVSQLRDNGWSWAKISRLSGVPERSLRRSFG